MKISLMKCVASCLALVMFMIGIAPRVDAGLVPSEIIMHSQIDRTEDLYKVQKVLELKMVKQRLEALGLKEGEIQKRLGQLSDEQIHNIALNLEQLRAGGQLEIIIALLVIAILVVLLIQLTGHRVIVK
jgi:hypothetical protein